MPQWSKGNLPQAVADLRLNVVLQLLFHGVKCPFFFASNKPWAYLKGSGKKLDLAFSFQLLRFLILTARLRVVSLVLI